MPLLDRFPILRALGAQALALALVLGCQAVLPRGPGWTWILFQGALAAGLARLWRLRGWWLGFQLLLPLALAWQAGTRVPGWIYPTLLLGWALVYGGGVLTRVPLYNSNRAAWAALSGLLPPEPSAFIDLGAGLGGPLAFLSRQHPLWRFEGVEASPLTWLLGWLRTRPRPNCRFHLGSLWKQNLNGFQVAYAFLSPAPMDELWRKVCAEMPPGSLFISHSFPVPGVPTEQWRPLPGRPGACLWVYRVPGLKADTPPAET